MNWKELQALLDEHDIAGRNSRAHAALDHRERLAADVDTAIKERRQADEIFDAEGAKHHERLAQQLMARWSQPRDLLAGHALYELQHALDAFEPAYRALVEQRKRDVGVTAPDALNGLDAAAMVNVSILRELRRSTIATMSARELAATYKDALQRRDASAYIDLALIEQRAEVGGLAKDEHDISSARELAELIEGVQLPLELAGIEDGIAEARRVLKSYERRGIQPVNITRDVGAAPVVEAEIAAMEAAAVP
jgi:hypothetical protein